MRACRRLCEASSAGRRRGSARALFRSPELDGRVDLKVLAELPLERDIDQHAGRIEVAEEENDDGLLSRQVVNVFGRLVSEGDAGKPAASIEANGELLAIGLHHTRDASESTRPTPRTGPQPVFQRSAR